MEGKGLILISRLCEEYRVEITFFREVEDSGLLEFENISDRQYIREEHLELFEKILRLHRDLEVNVEGIDVILNLMERISGLENQLRQMRSHLDLYED